MSIRPRAAFLAVFVFLAQISLLHAQSPSPSPTPKPPESKTEPVPEQSPTPDTRAVIDSLTPADVNEAMSQLKANYVEPASLSEQELSRATLEGLIDRIAPGAAIYAQAPQVPPASPFRSEILNNDIGYLRIGSLSKENIGQMDTALQGFRDKDLKSFILDLRATPPGGDFDMAAELLKRFCPKGKPLFTIKKTNTKEERVVASDSEPAVHGIIVVLADGDTSGAAEVVAGALRIYTNAMLVGANTAGQAVEFSDIPLSGGKILRVAVAELVLPGNVTIFPKGLKPDIAVDMSRDAREQVMAQSLEKGVGDFVFETERTRLNEAALVARTNPEIDAMEAAQKARLAGGVHAPPLRDTVLQHAMDLITSIGVYQGKPPDTIKPAP